MEKKHKIDFWLQNHSMSLLFWVGTELAFHSEAECVGEGVLAGLFLTELVQCFNFIRSQVLTLCLCPGRGSL